MTFLQPWAVWFLAGVPVIVALYFLRLKRRAMPVSTHLFWQRVLGENSRRAFFQRLRQWLSLLLHLLIFALLVAALARPLLHHAAQSGASTVIILDRRARMQATEPDGSTRFDKALDHARSLARQAAEGRQFALLTLDSAPSVAVPFSTDSKPLLDALDAIRPTDTAGDLDAALRLASSLIAGRTDHSIVLLSDRAPEDPDIAAPQIATSRDNVAITRFATRALPANPATSEVLVEIQNFGTAPVNTELELSFDGRVLDVKPFALQPGARRIEIFPSFTRPTRAGRGWLTARISAADALASDNVAYAALPGARPMRVLLVTAGNPFLEKLLTVDPTVKFQLITRDAWIPALAGKFEAVLFDGALPAGFDPTALPGNYFYLNSSPFPAGRKLDQPLITGIAAAHPTTRGLSLQNVSVLRATALAPPPPADGWEIATPLRSFDDTLLITGERNGRRFAALGFDLLDSDLPLRVAFPLLISNTLHWLAGDADSALPSVQAGDTFRLTDTQRAADEPLTSAPTGPPPTPVVTRFLQPMRNGFYAIAEGGDTRWLAVNTFSAAESDLRIPAAAAGRTEKEIRAPSLGPLPPWQWLALAAFALFTIEWWLFHRRKTE